MGNHLGAIDGIALDNGLEVNGVVHIDAVKADIVDMHRIMKSTFEDYGREEEQLEQHMIIPMHIVIITTNR